MWIVSQCLSFIQEKSEIGTGMLELGQPDAFAFKVYCPHSYRSSNHAPNPTHIKYLQVTVYSYSNSLFQYDLSHEVCSGLMNSIFEAVKSSDADS